MKPIALLLIWVGLGVVGSGFDNAYFQRYMPDKCHGRTDLGRALLIAPGGPISLFMTFLLTGFGQYGWSLSPAANPEHCLSSQSPSR